ncbi:hypothetical protein [Mechercharimyces sp. CAU 1602]|uniref:DUF7948 domain-containing protein n=1 Tax=Mechercharimyces sp. CAU 1602 TaxID=2973933 RepID=UPI002163E264|nr:hypothetical protein [Mechercharimyces sp. CAU 1602]MCS1351335.1 hypothetical protein [Mechercharimyces sp. CAU 1602]
MNGSDELMLRFVDTCNEVLPAGLTQSGHGYEQVIFKGVWPGIDVVFSGIEEQLKSDVIVHPI